MPSYYLKGDDGEVQNIKPILRSGFNRIEIREVANWQDAMNKFKKADVDFSTIPNVDIYECENINASDFPFVKNKLTFHKCKNLKDFGSWKGEYVYFEECTISEFRSGTLEFESASFQRCTFKCKLECAFIQKQLCLQYCDFFDPSLVVSCEKVDTLVVENCEKMLSLKVPANIKRLYLRSNRELENVGGEEFPSTLEHLEIRDCRALKTIPKFSSACKNVNISLEQNLNLLELDMNMASVIWFQLKRCPRLALVGYVRVQENCKKFDIQDCWSLSFRDAVRFTICIPIINEMKIRVGDVQYNMQESIVYASMVLFVLRRGTNDESHLPNELQAEVFKVLKNNFVAEVWGEEDRVLRQIELIRSTKITDMSKYLQFETGDQWKSELDDIERRLYAVRGLKR